MAFELDQLRWPINLLSIIPPDMNISHADPHSPYPRKAAFDLGDGGTGFVANNLRLSCDCLGSAVYIFLILTVLRLTLWRRRIVIALRNR